MARYDIKSDILQVIAFEGATISSDTTTDGEIIDMQGYNSVVFILQTGAVSAGDVTALIQDGDASNLSDASDVTDTFLSGTEASTLIDAANTTTRIGYVGKKRYVRLSAVSDNSANLYFSSIAVKGHGNVPTA